MWESEAGRVHRIKIAVIVSGKSNGVPTTTRRKGHGQTKERAMQTETRKVTIARMMFTFPDGRNFPFEYVFGYGYPLDVAEYMFTDGNFACDCNVSLLLSEKYPEIGEFECGNEITMSDFSVSEEEPNKK